MPLFVELGDISPLPHGYDVERRFNIICYPKLGILNNCLERADPHTPKEVLRHNPTRFNLFEHSLITFGSEKTQKCWIQWEIIHHHLSNLHDFLGVANVSLTTVLSSVAPDLLTLAGNTNAATDSIGISSPMIVCSKQAKAEVLLKMNA